LDGSTDIFITKKSQADLVADLPGILLFYEVLRPA